MREEGYVEDVVVIRSGAYMLSAASAGATTLFVEDAADFNDEGGTLTIEGTQYEYEYANMVTNSIELATGLVTAVDTETEVSVYPESLEKHASITISDNGEAVSAVVTHALFSRLEEGIRTEGREAVAIELVGGTWFVVDVIGQEPTPIKAEELDPEITGDILTAAEQAAQALADAEAAMDFATAATVTYRQPDQPTEGSLGDVWFDTDDGNHIYWHNGTTWIDARDLGIAGAVAQAEAAETAAQQALEAAENSMDFAETRNKVYYQDAMPTGGTYVLGDTWFDTNDGNRIYVYNGTTFVDSQDTGISEAIKAYSTEYAVNASETVAPTTGWSTATPTRTAGTFIWTRTVVTYGDNTTSTTSPALLTGNTGEAGAAGAAGAQGPQGPTGSAGVGITSITPYYQTVATGAAAPAKPVVSPPPAPWTTTEPNYVVDTELYRTDRIVYTDGSFAYSDVTKVSSYTAASTAVSTANGKNKIVFSTSDASGTGYSTGDVWFKKSGTLIVAQWEFVSGAWASRTLDSATIANLNVGKLVGGDISAITVNINSTGVIKSNNYSASTAGWKLDANGLEMNSGVITGATYQTTAAVSRGVKITNTGLTAYDGAGVATLIVDGSTGAITMKGSLTSGSDITGATITSSGSGVIQTEVTAARGIKMNSAGLTAYNSSGTPTFTITASTGAVAMLGSLTSGSTIAGAVITGTLETTATASRGVKITSSALTAYDSVGTPTLSINTSTGAVSMKGSLTSGSDVSGATITSSGTGVIQTEATASRGIKMNSSGLTAYDNLGAPTFTITASTGAVAMKGTLTSGSSITGSTVSADSTGVIRSSSGSNRVELKDNGTQGTVDFYYGGTRVGWLTAHSGGIGLKGVASTGISIFSDRAQTEGDLHVMGNVSTSGWVETSEIYTSGGVTGNQTLDIGGTNTWVKLYGSMKSGTKSASVAALNTDYSTSVSFPTAFPTTAPVPEVTINAKVTNPHHVTCSVTGISRSGFTINYRRSAGATGSIDIGWIAVAS